MKKRIAAIVGIVLLSSLYIMSLITALLGKNELFLAFLFSAVMIPILVYGFIYTYRMVHKKDDYLDDNDNTDDDNINE